MNAPAQRWPGFKYEPVRGLMDRHISRYLRTQRKTMIRFFTERGLLQFTELMQQIRKSRQGMIAKNEMFKKVLDDYAKLVNPAPPDPTEAAEAIGEASQPAVEAADREDTGDDVLAVPADAPEPTDASGPRSGSDVGVFIVEDEVDGS